VRRDGLVRVIVPEPRHDAGRRRPAAAVGAKPLLYWTLSGRAWASTWRSARDDTMTGKTLQDLVGRVMLDREFLSRLAGDPDGILAGYDLTADERDVIVEALGRAAHVPEEERAYVLQTVMLRRWAT
jgi:hypothetical protein